VSADAISEWNRKVRLAARPVGLPGDEIWSLVDEPVPTAGEDELLIKVLYLSVDPAMRAWLNEGRSYVPPVGIGEVMRAGGVGRVVASNRPGFSVGDHVTGLFGVQEYAVSDGRDLVTVDPDFAPLPRYLGALGTSGLTAYFGLLEVGELREASTVVVSGAAGSVGTVAVQIAKLKGCRVVGIAGGSEKCAYLVGELGIDAAIDYKSEDVRAALREHCPDRIDLFFDNVGGEVLEAALSRLARGARVVLCGAISQYNADEGGRGPANYMNLLVNRARMEGFVVFDYADRYPEASRELAGWLADGRLKAREDVTEGGVAAFPEALRMLFRGDNTGKLVLHVAD
jgi:NADPH-dependent curcumin reductase CurA